MILADFLVKSFHLKLSNLMAKKSNTVNINWTPCNLTCMPSDAGNTSLWW